MRRCTGRSGGGAGASWTLLGLLACAAAAQELYDDRQARGEETGYYEDDNFLDLGAAAAAAAAANHQQRREWTKDIILYNFIRSLAHEDPRDTLKYTPDWIQALDEDIAQHQKDQEYIESPTLDTEGVVKRLASAAGLRGGGGGGGAGRAGRSLARRGRYNAAQAKHKKGSRMVCYFKLCAFHP